MPNYDYRCSECGETFSRIVPIAERKEQQCSCGGIATQIVSAPWQKIDIESDRWLNRHKKRNLV